MDFGAGFRKLALGALTVGSFLAGGSTGHAQQVTGTLGSADATTTINGKQIPPPPPKFGGVIKETAKESTPGGRRASCPLRVRPTYYSS